MISKMKNIRCISLILKFLKKILKINLWKTLYFNFHYFPFKVAIKLPVFIYFRSNLFLMDGKIVINSPVSTGMVIFGAHGLGTQDKFYQRTIWEVSGTLIIEGQTKIGRGCKISIGKNGVLKLGENFTITGNTSIICQKEIIFGNNCLLSWDILMMDTDFHKIINDKNETVNSNKSITIGDHVWIGCRNTILKGVSIPSDSVISAGSLIAKSFYEENCIIGGHGRNAEIIKRGINWEF